MMPFFIVISFLMSMVKISALFTIRKQRWLTRDVAVSAQNQDRRPNQRRRRSGRPPEALPEGAR